MCIPLQSLLLCVPAVLVTMWFSWLCLGKPPTGSRPRPSSHGLPLSPLALSVTPLATETISAGLIASWSPMATVAGASVPVSTAGSQEALGSDGVGRLTAPCFPQPVSAVDSAPWTTDSGSSWMSRCSVMPRRSSSAASRSVSPSTAQTLNHRAPSSASSHVLRTHQLWLCLRLGRYLLWTLLVSESMMEVISVTLQSAVA